MTEQNNESQALKASAQKWHILLILPITFHWPKASLWLCLNPTCGMYHCPSQRKTSYGTPNIDGDNKIYYRYVWVELRHVI